MKRLLGGLAVVLLVLTLLGQDGSAAPPDYVGQYEHYAVAADHPLASEAGAVILEQGGNAADAAAATMLALGVVSPASSGLGGGGFALYYRASDQSLTYLDFRERAPSASTPDMFANAEARSGEGPLAQPSQLGGLASGVPGEPAGIAALLERFGSLPRERVVAPALRLASQGFPIDEDLARLSRSFGAQLRQDPGFRRWFHQTDELVVGDTLRQPELARTLQDFAREGARPFYEGRIARAIVAANRRAGGIMTLEDLRDYRVREREPLIGDRFGYRWVTAPPPSAGGYTILQSLLVLERIAPTQPVYGAPWLHALAESWKGPYLDRQYYFGDPDAVDVPLAALMNEPRTRSRVDVFHPALAMPAEDYERPLSERNDNVVQPDGGGTSHLCVVDAEGNVASITTTVNLPFGARYSAAGIVMNDEMDDFAREIGAHNAFGLPGGAPNLPGPGRRPVSSMSPTIVFRDGAPVLCVGASGGSRIITATQQTALNVLVLGMNAGDAVGGPRIHHQGRPNQLRTEQFAPLDEELLAELVARGHIHEPIQNVATVQMIHLQDAGSSRSLTAVSDPRKGGRPAGE